MKPSVDYRLHIGSALDVLKTMTDQSVNCCVSSPPYWKLRDYGVEGQLGLEKTPEEYVEKVVEIFREVRRVLMDDGTLWLNIGDSYAGGGRAGYSGNAYGGLEAARKKTADRIYGAPTGKIEGIKTKDLVGIPWMVAFALRNDGWFLRQDIIWHKPNPMPESVRDRCTKAHEYIFLMSRSQKYYYDYEAIKEPDSGQDHTRSILEDQDSLEPTGGLMGPHRGLRRCDGRNGLGRNKRSVWFVPTKPFLGAHFAVFPPNLIEPCILAGCPEGGTVLDPFTGSGTTGEVAMKHFRNFVGIELNPTYAKKIAIPRIEAELKRHKQMEII